MGDSKQLVPVELIDYTILVISGQKFILHFILLTHQRRFTFTS